MTTTPSQPRRRLALTLKALQVRLRFVIVLVVAFAIVGQWNVLRNYWDRLWHQMSGGNSASHSVSDDTEYFCPMDPGVISDWPAICPVCNMDLVRRKKGDAVTLPDGVVARMQFSPYRIQLAGIKTSLVEPKSLAREIVLIGRVASEDSARHSSDGSEAAATRIVATAYEADLRWLTAGRVATIQADGIAGVPAAVVETAAGQTAPGDTQIQLRFERSDPRIRPGASVRAIVSIPLREFEPFRSSTPESESGAVLAVPETAVVDTGSRQVVYVESMPGMFDGIEVTVGPRCGDFIPIVKGLEAGQRVATAGAFLIDAEARLNPSLAAGYFGANRADSAATRSTTSGAASAKKPATTGKSKLSAADRALAKKQKVCPVTDLPLDSMGGPVPVEVAGRKVFICCKGCEGKLKGEPEKYLAKLKAAK